MDQLTITIPDGLSERQKAELAKRLSQIAQDVASHWGENDGGSLMALAGSMKYSGPAVDTEEARARLLEDVAEDYLGRKA